VYPWGGWEGSACKDSMFALAWIKGIKDIKVSGGGGGMWCIFNSPEKKIKKYPMFFCCILCYIFDVTFSVMSEVCVGPQN
jgi:hypothetical protein